MKIKLIFILLFVAKVGMCQNLIPNKHQINRLFNSSFDKESEKKLNTGSVVWTICNQDSAFFKADTIKLYSEINYFYQFSSCCHFIQWTFYKKHAFIQSSLQICNEPSSGSITTLNDYFNIKLLRGNLLEILNAKGDPGPEFFVIINVDEIKLARGKSKIITLKRFFRRGEIIGTVY